MEDDTKARLFNAKSGHFREQMDERGKALWDAQLDTTENGLAKQQARHDQWAPKNYRDEADRIYGKLRADMQAPRPEDVPPPKMPTMAEIRAQARERVDQRHEAAMERIRADGQAALDRLIDATMKRDRAPER